VTGGTFDLEALMAAVTERFSLETVPDYPPVLEDIAVVVDEATEASEVERVIYRAGGELLEDVRLFDFYRGEQIGVGKKSLAYSLVYQSPERTLTDEQVAEVRQRIIGALAQELDAELRS
jgi:phenylalanyl-tRNA synthetase beta chain